MPAIILSSSIRFDQWQEQRATDYLNRLDTIARWAPWPATAADDRMELGRQVETQAAEILRDRGHMALLTNHKAAYDIQAGGCMIEVKAARRYPHQKGGARYQCNLHNRADLLIMACCDGYTVRGWFIIPAAEIGERRNLAIWSDPENYAGRWAPFLEAWDIADRAIEAAGPHPAQLTLWEAKRWQRSSKRVTIS